MTAELFFWICLAIAGYTFAGYPLLAIALARWRGSTPSSGAELPAITVVIAARNEAARIGARLRNLFDSDYPAHALQVLLVDDGSDDDTAAVALASGDRRVRVLRQGRTQGKAAALNLAMPQVRTALTIYADARQRFERGTLAALVAPFADAQVAVVSGELHLDAADGAGHAVAADGSYARIERALRCAEARLGWAHAASGAIYAIRTELFQPLPADLILDDVYTPAQALRHGARIWVARDARAFDVAGSEIGHEFRRKLRTLAGNWQVMAELPWLLNPWRNPAFFAWVSHKVLRLLAPWALLGALAASALAVDPWVRAAFWVQLTAYAVALLTLQAPGFMRRVPLAATAGSFVALNTAALVSLPVFLGTRQLGQLWRA